MSLNDEQMSDLENEQAALAAGDQSGIDIPPVVVVDVPEEDTSNQIEEQKIEEEMLKEQVALKKLDDADTKVALVNNQSVKVQDLMDVSNLVLGAESIDQATADQVNVVTGDFYNNSGIIREEFTNLPTRTNLSETKGYVTKRTNEEIEELHKLFMDLFNNEIQALQAMRKALATKAFPVLQKAVCDMERAVSFRLNDLGKSNRFIFSFPTRNEKEGRTDWSDPINLLSTTLGNQTWRKTENKFCDDVILTGYSIANSFKEIELNNLLKYCCNEVVTPERDARSLVYAIPSGDNERSKEISHLQTPMEIFGFVAAGGFSRMIEKLCSGMDAIEHFLTSEPPISESESTELRKHVTELDNAKDFIRAMRFTYQAYVSLTLVVPAIHKLFVLFETQLDSPELK